MMNKDVKRYWHRKYLRLKKRGAIHMDEADFNENDHPRNNNGQFAPKDGVAENESGTEKLKDKNGTKVKTSFESTKLKYRIVRNNLVKKLQNKPDGTYDPDTGEALNFDDGFQAAFQTSISEDLNDDGYMSDDDYDRTCEELSKKTGSKAYVGKFDVPEVSFHCKTMDEAMEIAKKYNQMSIMDWAKFNELKDGDWSDEDEAKMFPPNPFYDSSKNHVKGA